METTRFPFRLFSLILYTAGLALFYFRYVPLIPAYQAWILPPLFAVMIMTGVDARKGVLLFAFLFPLVNGLPYFFGIHEPFPHAPAALVLFLFFFGASWPKGPSEPSGLRRTRHPLLPSRPAPA